MKRIEIIGDPGSTHCGDLDKAKRLIDIGKDCGLDAVKFQLFPDSKEFTSSGNIAMPFSWYSVLTEYGRSAGVQVFASAFSEFAAHEIIRHTHCKKIKFAYGNSPGCRGSLENHPVVDIDYLHAKSMIIYGSGDYTKYPEWADVKLFCVPEYPVTHTIDFSEKMFDRFDGFSDHSLGSDQAMFAKMSGAQVFEKHYQGDWDSDCPDAVFALRPHELRRHVNYLHGRRL